MLNRESIYAKCNCKYHQKLRLQIVSVYYEFISIHPTGKKGRKSNKEIESTEERNEKRAKNKQSE